MSETTEMRKAQTEPQISVTIQPREEWINFIDMKIQNIGLGPAYNVQFLIDPDFEYDEGKRLSELGFAKNGIQYFAPNQALQFILTSMVEDYDRKVNASIGIKVSYQNVHHRSYVNTYMINFSELEGLTQGERSPLYKVSRSIDRLNKEVQGIAKELKRNRAGGSTRRTSDGGVPDE